MSKLHVVHESAARIGAFADAFATRRLLWQEWLVDDGAVDVAAIAPKGMFYSRMSASAQTRDHRHAPSPSPANSRSFVPRPRRLATRR